MSAMLESPRLRPGLAAMRDGQDPSYYYVWDRSRMTHRPQRLTAQEVAWMQLFDGQRTLQDIHAAVAGEGDRSLASLEQITALAKKLGEALFLDNQHFCDYLTGADRDPSCIGSYEAEPAALRRQIAQQFIGPKGPGLPQEKPVDGRLRAALIPHIDYPRGGQTYAWGFKEVFEHSLASLFVIIGTSHYGPSQRYTLTRKNFKTPLGVARTDQAYIDRLVDHYGDGLFDDEMVHLPEHSIELEVVFLQYLYEGKRPIRIVPLVVGSFQDCIDDPAQAPLARSDIGRMIEGLRRAEAETLEPICYIISGDLAHLGPKFNDPLPVYSDWLSRSRNQDHALLDRAAAGDPAGFFGVIAQEKDERRICGLPPTYTVLEAVRPSRGRLLHYDQYVHPRGQESVSFASVAFYQ
jgi:AmmeMemoRadiSam system protein B